jgi:hypothetical protein
MEPSCRVYADPCDILRSTLDRVAATNLASGTHSFWHISRGSLNIVSPLGNPRWVRIKIRYPLTKTKIAIQSYALYLSVLGVSKFETAKSTNAGQCASVCSSWHVLIMSGNSNKWKRSQLVSMVSDKIMQPGKQPNYIVQEERLKVRRDQ